MKASHVSTLSWVIVFAICAGLSCARAKYVKPPDQNSNFIGQSDDAKQKDKTTGDTTPTTTDEPSGEDFPSVLVIGENKFEITPTPADSGVNPPGIASQAVIDYGDKVTFTWTFPGSTKSHIQVTDSAKKLVFEQSLEPASAGSLMVPTNDLKKHLPPDVYHVVVTLTDQNAHQTIIKTRFYVRPVIHLKAPATPITIGTSFNVTFELPLAADHIALHVDDVIEPILTMDSPPSGETTKQISLNRLGTKILKAHVQTKQIAGAPSSATVTIVNLPVEPSLPLVLSIVLGTTDRAPSDFFIDDDAKFKWISQNGKQGVLTNTNQSTGKVDTYQLDQAALQLGVRDLASKLSPIEPGKYQAKLDVTNEDNSHVTSVFDYLVRPTLVLLTVPGTPLPEKLKPYSIIAKVAINVDKIILKSPEGILLKELASGVKGPNQLTFDFPATENLTLIGIAIRNGIESPPANLNLASQRCQSIDDCEQVVKDRCKDAVERTIELAFENTPECPWEVGQNLSRLNRYLRAHKEISSAIPLRENHLLCGIKSIHSAGKTIHYDDHFMMALDNTIILSSFTNFKDKVAKSGDFFVFDWLKIRGQQGLFMGDVDDRKTYCIGSKDKCKFSSHDVVGDFNLELDEAQVTALLASSLVTSSKLNPHLQVLLFGDDNDHDCEFHVDDQGTLKLNLTILEASEGVAHD